MITFIPRNPGTPAALRAALVVRDDGPGLRVPQIRQAAWLHLKGLRVAQMAELRPLPTGDAA